MIGIIWKKELTEIFRTPGISWLFAGIIFIMGLSLYSGTRYALGHSEMLQQSQERTYQQFISQGYKNPHLGAHFGFYAYKPTADLAFLDNGIEEYTGNSFYLEPHKQGVLRFKEVDDSTGLRNFGFFNMGFFMQFIFPLIIFLLCHNVFSKEWENGTIKMMMSTNVTAKQVFIGKLLACFTIIGSVLLLGFLGNFTVMIAVLHKANATSMAAFAWHCTGVLLLALVLTMISTGVSVITCYSGLALVYLAGFWLMGVFLIPRVAAEISRQVYPAQTALDFENTTFNLKQYGRPGEGHKDLRREHLADSIMNQYKVKRLEDLPVFFIPITIEYFEDSDGEIMTAAYAQVAENERKQDRLVLGFSILSPFFAFRDFSMAMAASDMESHHDFEKHAKIHRRKVGVRVNNFYQNNTVAGNDFWKSVPQFSYTQPPALSRLRSGTAAFAILMIWLLAAIVLIRLSIKNFKV